MQNLVSLQSLRDNLPAPEVETSYAAVFVDGPMGAEHLAAAAEAKRVCDVAVVFSLVELAPTALKALEAEDVDAVVQLTNLEEGPVQADFNGKNCTKILQSLLELLPSVVITANVDLSLWHKLRAILTTFPDLFLLQKVPVKISYLPAALAEVRQEIINLPVKNEAQLTKDVFDVLTLHKISKVETLQFLDLNTLLELPTVPLNKKFGVYFQGLQAGKPVKDLVVLESSLLKRMI